MGSVQKELAVYSPTARVTDLTAHRLARDVTLHLMYRYLRAVLLKKCHRGVWNVLQSWWSGDIFVDLDVYIEVRVHYLLILDQSSSINQNKIVNHVGGSLMFLMKDPQTNNQFRRLI